VPDGADVTVVPDGAHHCSKKYRVSFLPLLKLAQWESTVTQSRQQIVAQCGLIGCTTLLFKWCVNSWQVSTSNSIHITTTTTTESHSRQIVLLKETAVSSGMMDSTTPDQWWHSHTVWLISSATVASLWAWQAAARCRAKSAGSYQHPASVCSMSSSGRHVVHSATQSDPSLATVIGTLIACHLLGNAGFMRICDRGIIRIFPKSVHIAYFSAYTVTFSHFHTPVLCEYANRA